MITSIPTVTIATPVRNRDWMLSYFLSGIEALSYPEDKLGFHFILNDSTDLSGDILRQWRSRCYFEHKRKYRYIKINEVNMGCPKDLGEDGKGRDSQEKNKELSFMPRDMYTYKALSILRNLALDVAKLDSDLSYLWFVDSDVILCPGVLNSLLATGKHIVAALISNACGQDTAYNFLHFNGLDRKVIPDKLFEVKTTGACMLISKEVFNNKGVRYTEEYGTGEDAGFCETARQQGYKCFVLVEKQQHIMKREQLLIVNQSEMNRWCM